MEQSDTDKMDGTTQSSDSTEHGVKSRDDRSENWEDLATMLQEKANRRLDDTALLTSRASLAIAAVAFLVPCVLEQNLDLFSFIIIATLICASLACIVISIFLSAPVPIDTNGAISMLESEKYCNMSREDFSKWKARSYRDGLMGFNKAYRHKRNLQLASFILLSLAIVLLFLFKCVTICSMSDRKLPTPPEPDPSVGHEEFSAKNILEQRSLDESERE